MKHEGDGRPKCRLTAWSSCRFFHDFFEEKLWETPGFGEILQESFTLSITGRSAQRVLVRRARWQEILATIPGKWQAEGKCHFHSRGGCPSCRRIIWQFRKYDFIQGRKLIGNFINVGLGIDLDRLLDENAGCFGFVSKPSPHHVSLGNSVSVWLCLGLCTNW